MRKKKVQELLASVHGKVNALERELFEHDSVLTHCSKGTLDSRMKNLERQLGEVKRMFLDHHETVLVQDPNDPRGYKVLTMYEVYRGKDHQGNTIHTIPAVDRDGWTYVILDPRLMQGGREARAR